MFSIGNAVTIFALLTEKSSLLRHYEIERMNFPFFGRGLRPSVHAADALRFPLAGPVRIALLEGSFRAGNHMRQFGADDLEWLRSYAPDALVTPLDLALSLADWKRLGRFDLPTLTTAIVVLSSLDHSTLSWRQRDLLWRAFGVPIFEQLRGWEGTVIARECEVHDGLHIDESAPAVELRKGELLVTHARTGLTGEIVRGLCECGAETPRLRNINVLNPKATAAAA